MYAENLTERLERARQQTRRPGDEFVSGGWARPRLLPPPPKPDHGALAIRCLFLLAVAMVLTLAVIAIGAHS